ncbi:MAG: hypothetical protein HN390_05415 [Anaerolineae bacterium]|jgi:hypothetical protein|nr:hypothetical protein [Anaerolineae bacterium]MBT7191092.1 hypothetical protein [Anaerolineae bacterium]MBT7988479.1 hypothetical protein [Anaerolineae bacterium]
MSYIALAINLLLGTSALAWGYYDGGYPNVSSAILAIGLFWGISIWRRWRWFAKIGFIAYTLSAAVGLWLNLPFGWMLAGGVGGLLVYDLSAFIYRLRFAAPGEDVKRLSLAHLARLGLLIVLTLIFSSIAMLWQSAFSFEWAVFLGLASVWGLSLLVRWMLRK